MSEMAGQHCYVFQHSPVLFRLRLACGLLRYVSDAAEAKPDGQANLPVRDFPGKVSPLTRDKPNALKGLPAIDLANADSQNGGYSLCR